MKNNQLVLRYSRWKTVIPLFFGIAIFFMGIPMVSVRIFGEGIGGRIFGILFGILLIMAGFLLFSINLLRFIMKPKIFSMNENGVDYYRGLFGSKKKKLFCFWNDIESIKLEKKIIYTNKNMGDTKIGGPTKVSYIQIKVRENVLDSYDMFKDNLFLSNNKTLLSINLDQAARFSINKFEDYCQNYCGDEKRKQLILLISKLQMIQEKKI